MLTNALERLHRLPGALVSGTALFERDADIYVILDGCRVTTFRTCFPDAESYWSVGASSKEWLKATFNDHTNVAYVTGNPFADRVRDNVGYLHRERVQDCNGVETVPPDVLVDHAAAVWGDREEYGVDTVVVHLMQPHVPFRSRPEWFSGRDDWGSARWHDIDTDIDRQEWFKAYRDNLRWAIEDGVERLRRRVDATIGVTADHGNAAGEWGVWAHPSGVAVPAVRKVPWTTVDGEAVEAVGQVAASASRDRKRDLEALGYLEEVAE